MAKILYVSRSYSPHDRRFLTRLADSSHEIYFVPCVRDGDGPENSNIPARVHRLPALSEGNSSFSPLHLPAMCLEFRAILKEVKPDLVQAGPVQQGGFLAALSGFHPLLIMSWGSDILSVPQTSKWMRWVTQFTLSRADAMLVDCLAVRHEIVRFTNSSHKQIVCFPWGIDLERFRPKKPTLDLRDRLGWCDCPVIVSARSLEPIHGAMIFLEAMKQVIEAQPNVRILLLGDGSLRPRVEEFLREHESEEKFHVAGRVPEEMLPDYFAEVDLYVSSAPCDGSSVSLLEAMGCGLSVVVPDVGGNREWVKHGKNGWLYPAGDVPSLSNTALEAISCAELRAEFGKLNVGIVRARADWAQNFNQLLALYERLLEQAPALEIQAYAQLQNR
jgi:L-malate glycosyltransferase